MIKLSKTISSDNPGVIQLKQNSVPQLGNVNERLPDNINLNNMPYYPLPSKKDKINAVKSCLDNFYSQFGSVKSATFVCEEIKRAEKKNASQELSDELFKKRRKYSAKTKQTRKDIWNKDYNSFEEYVINLKQYIKKNGNYINCNECADIMLYDLQKKGIPANNIAIFSVNANGEQTSAFDHVFTVAFTDKNCDISKPETWGKDAIICDAWLNMCCDVKTGIEKYKDFFSADYSKTFPAFEYCNKKLSEI